MLFYRMMGGNSKDGSIKGMGVVSASVRKDFLLEAHGIVHVCCWSGESHNSQ